VLTFVITEEDMLEFLHHMQAKSAAAEHLFDALRDNHLLFIGCSFPDWLSRFLLRIAKSRQLPLRRTEMELLVGSLTNRDSDLLVFLQHFSKRTKVASCSPAEFVGELAARYTSRVAGSAGSLADQRCRPPCPRLAIMRAVKPAELLSSYMTTAGHADLRLTRAYSHTQPSECRRDCLSG
jgi:hypothetical protein